MSSTVFYSGVLARDLSPEIRTLTQVLLSRSEQVEALAAELPSQIRANRARREGKPQSLPRSAKGTIRSFDRDARDAAAELPALLAGVRSEFQVVRIALECERSELALQESLYSAAHPEDAALARPLLEKRAENIGELEAFLSATTRPEGTTE
jgi:hypothetical protein